MMIDDSRTISLLQTLALLRAEQMHGAQQAQTQEWRQWLQRRVAEVIEELKEED